MNPHKHARLTKIEADKAHKLSLIHVTSGERRALRQKLGSRSARKNGTKHHSFISKKGGMTRNKIGRATSARVRLRAEIDKLMLKKTHEALGG